MGDKPGGVQGQRAASDRLASIANHVELEAAADRL